MIAAVFQEQHSTGDKNKNRRLTTANSLGNVFSSHRYLETNIGRFTQQPRQLTTN